MGIRPRFTNSDIRNILTERVERITTAVLNRLKYVGETFVKNARRNATFTDRTGNLRNSIGYLILQNGTVIYENFKKSATVYKTIKSGKNKGQQRRTLGGKEGVSVGKDIAHQVAATHPRGLVLVVVAGMEYAAAVEAKGYDVLTSSSIIAKRELEQALQKIKEKIPRMR